MYSLAFHPRSLLRFPRPMTSSLSLHNKEQRKLWNDVSIDCAMRKAKPTEGEVLVFLILTNPGYTLHLTVHLFILHLYINFIFDNERDRRKQLSKPDHLNQDNDHNLRCMGR